MVNNNLNLTSFQCNTCNRKFKHKGHLNVHIASIHEEKKFECTSCSVKFTQKGSLDKHVASAHEGIKFDCDLCDVKFTQKGHLKKHVASVHNKAHIVKIKINQNRIAHL